MVGPFIDLTAGTSEEALTVDATEVWLSKNGADYVNKNEATAAVHKKSGMYLMVLDATDTNTVGTLNILVDDTADAAIPVSLDCQVIETAIYDALYANTAAGFNSSGQVSLLTATQASIDAVEADTNEIQGDWTNGGRLDLLLDSVVAAVVAALSEPAQGNIDHTATMAAKVSMIMKLIANKRDQTAILQRVYNSDESTVDHKAVISSDGTTLTFGEMKTGP